MTVTDALPPTPEPPPEPHSEPPPPRPSRRTPTDGTSGIVQSGVVLAAVAAAAVAMATADGAELWFAAGALLVGAVVALARGRWMARPEILLMAVMLFAVHRWQFPAHSLLEAVTVAVAGLAIVYVLAGTQRQTPTATGLAIAGTIVLLSTVASLGAMRWIGVVGCVIACVAVRRDRPDAPGAGVVVAVAADVTTMLVALGMLVSMTLIGDFTRAVLVPFAAMVLAGLGIIAVWGRFSELLDAEVIRATVVGDPDPVMELASDGVLLQASAPLQSLALESGDDLLSRLDDHSAQLLGVALAAGDADALPRAVQVQLVTDDRGWRQLDLTLRFLGREANSWLAQVEDHTEDVLARHRQEVELGRLRDAVVTDRLTGVLNREGVLEALDAQLRSGAATVVFLDLDSFKSVNDSHGHEAGDAVLSAVAQRLHGAVASEWHVGRLGGDEFLLVGPRNALQPGDLPHLGALIEQPITHGELEFQVGASLGVATGEAGADPDALLRTADAEMYRHKQRRRAGGADAEALDAAGMPVVEKRRLSQLFTR